MACSRNCSDFWTVLKRQDVEWGDLDGDCYFPPDGPTLIQSQSCQKSSCNCLFCFIGTPDGCRGYNYEQHLKSVSGAKKAQQNADDIRSSDSTVSGRFHPCVPPHSLEKKR